MTASQGLGKDYYCVIASLVIGPPRKMDPHLEVNQLPADLIMGLSITEIEATVHGYGNHMYDLSKVQIHQALEVSCIKL